MSAVDISGAMFKFDIAARQVPFAIAATLTALAKDGQDAGTRRINDALDRPTRFTQQAVAIIPARKATPVATVLVKDIQAQYLAIEEAGGVRTPQPGAPVLTPVQISLDPHGNIGKGRVRRLRQRKATFVSAQDTPRTAHLPPGIYQRFPAPRGRRKGQPARPPLLLVAFHKRAAYDPILGFRKAVIAEVLFNVNARWTESVARALATAR